MKIEPRRAPLAEAAAHQDDSTPEFEAGTVPAVHRRTTVTVERETLSILMRRTRVAPADEPAGADANPNSTEIEAGREPK
jgi:hypothetical protein